MDKGETFAVWLSVAALLPPDIDALLYAVRNYKGTLNGTRPLHAKTWLKRMHWEAFIPTMAQLQAVREGRCEGNA